MTKDGQRVLEFKVLHTLTGQQIADSLAVHADVNYRFRSSFSVHLTPNLSPEETLQNSFDRMYGSQFKIMRAVKSNLTSGLQLVRGIKISTPDNPEYYHLTHEQLREAALKHVKLYFPDLWPPPTPTTE